VFTGADTVIGGQEIADEDATEPAAEQFLDDLTAPMAIDVINHAVSHRDAPQPVIDPLLPPAVSSTCATGSAGAVGASVRRWCAAASNLPIEPRRGTGGKGQMKEVAQENPQLA